MPQKPDFIAIEANELECFATLACMPSVKLERTPKYTRVYTGQDFWLFNGVFRLRLDQATANEDLDELVD